MLRANDYSTEIAALQAANIALLYVGGYHTEVALMARVARDRGYSVQFVSGNAMAIEELALIAGPAAEGILFTFAPDPRRNPKPPRLSRGSVLRTSSPMVTLCLPMQPSKPGRRLSTRPRRWSRKR